MGGAHSSMDYRFVVIGTIASIALALGPFLALYAGQRSNHVVGATIAAVCALAWGLIRARLAKAPITSFIALLFTLIGFFVLTRELILLP
jgi:hypothetical protein